MSMNLKRILITAGEPAGIGPDVVLQSLMQAHMADILVVADPELLKTRAALLNLPIIVQHANLQDALQEHLPGVIRVLPVHLKDTVIPGTLNKANAAYVLECLQLAAHACLNHKAQAIVTAPVQKSIINEAGFHFRGHTEFFAETCGVHRTLMFFVCDHFKAALATTHLALKDVSHAITKNHLNEHLKLLHHGLQRWFHIQHPRILVCGLNPHAGENGYLGREEIDVIAPAIEALNQQGLNLVGPVSADTAFTPKSLKNTDAVLAMYHDQVLPLVKYASFGHAVNVTLGLPFLRTSVDHGTALDIAGTGQADADSLLAALRLAMTC